MGIDFYKITEFPVEEPVTLDEAKEWCKVTHSTEDILFTSLIRSATSKIELATNRVFIEREFNGFFSGRTCSRFEQWPYISIRRAPLIEINSIEVSENELPIIIPSTSYSVKETSGFSRIMFTSTDVFPDYTPYPWVINFKAGYGLRSDVPGPIKDAILQAVCYWYSNKGDCEAGQELPGISKGILREYRILDTFGC